MFSKRVVADHAIHNRYPEVLAIHVHQFFLHNAETKVVIGRIDVVDQRDKRSHLLFHRGERRVRKIQNSFVSCFDCVSLVRLDHKFWMIHVDLDALFGFVILFVMFVQIGDLALLTWTDNEELFEKIAFLSNLSADFS